MQVLKINLNWENLFPKSSDILLTNCIATQVFVGSGLMSYNLGSVSLVLVSVHANMIIGLYFEDLMGNSIQFLLEKD